MKSHSSKQAVGYVRKSTDEQRLESLDAQEREIRDYAKSLGILDVKIFADDGISGKTDKRPAFQDAINHAIDNKVDAFIVHKFDRFSRNKYDSAIYKQKLEKASVKILSVIERSTGAPEDIILESLYEGMAEYYSANLGREVMKGLKENAFKAQFNGGNPPLGYDVDEDKHYIINEKEALIVQRLFNMISEGMSYNDVLSEFKMMGYLTKNKKAFGKNSIYGILINERYKGTYIFNKRKKRSRDGTRNSHSKKDESEIIRIDDAIPAIIDADTFDRVQEIIKLRKNDGAANKAKQVYLLQGVIHCGECGSAMHGNRRKNGSGENYISYRCGAKERKMTCSNKEIQRDSIEDFVLRILEKSMFNPGNVKRLVKKVNDTLDKQLNGKSESEKRIEMELQDNTQKLNNILRAIEDGQVHEVLFQRLNEIQKEKTRLEKEQEEQRLLGIFTKISEEEIRTTFNSYKEIMNNDDRQLLKGLIRRFVKRINVFEDRIELEFSTVFSFANLTIPLLDDLVLMREGALLAS